MKIFKYEIIDGKVAMPLNAQVIRIDNICDGNFVWAIVNPNDKNYLISASELKEPIKFSESKLERQQLSIKEKQSIITSGKPKLAREESGKLYIFYTPGEIEKKYNVCMYKTGQNIDKPVESLTYLGLCKLFICQELGLYTFLEE